MVLSERIELSASSLQGMRSTTELRQHLHTCGNCVRHALTKGQLAQFLTHKVSVVFTMIRWGVTICGAFGWKQVCHGTRLARLQVGKSRIRAT